MQDHLKTVEAIYEAFGRGDIPTILEKISDEVRWEEWTDNQAQKSGVPWLQRRQGKDGVLEFFKEVSHLQIMDFQILSMMSGGNQVVVEVVIEANVPATGRRYRDEELHLWTFDENGKVIRMRHYTDTARHIAAAKQSQ